MTRTQCRIMAPMASYPTDYRDPWIDENGLLHFQIGMQRPSMTRVREMFQQARELTAEGLLPLIVDGRAMRIGPPAPVWTFAIYRLAGIASAIAFLFSDESPPEVWKFQKGLGALMLPTRTFEEEEEAVAWLQSFSD